MNESSVGDYTNLRQEQYVDMESLPHAHVLPAMVHEQHTRQIFHVRSPVSTTRLNALLHVHL